MSGSGYNNQSGGPSMGQYPVFGLKDNQGKKRKIDMYPGASVRDSTGGVSGINQPQQGMNIGGRGGMNQQHFQMGGRGAGKSKSGPDGSTNNQGQFLMNPVQGKKKKLAELAAYRAHLEAQGGVNGNDVGGMGTASGLTQANSSTYIQNQNPYGGIGQSSGLGPHAGLTGLSGYNTEIINQNRQQQNMNMTGYINQQAITTSTGLLKIPPDLAPTKSQMQAAQYSHMSATLERKFFDQVKEVLTQYSRESWLEFVKCLELFSSNAINKDDMLSLVKDLFGG